ncbi:MAG: hypothetical protein AB7C90_02130 [Bacteroidales bacterium]
MNQGLLSKLRNGYYAFPELKSQSKFVNVKRAGFFFPLPVPSDAVLCAMKLSALLTRRKGRDFDDAMFLLGLTEPDYGYLAAKKNRKRVIVCGTSHKKTANLLICQG